ncbi:MAG: hypothetical protein WCT14_06245 [Treponemataceae bacterium]
MRNFPRGFLRIACPLILFLKAVFSAPAEISPTIALSDLSVNSSDPGYTFIGKGFTEIVAFELKKAPGIRLVDRSRRNEALKEMEFSLSGIAEEKNRLEIGKLLSVNYIVGGSITDMKGTLLVSLSLVDVETGEIVWNDQLVESSGKYAYFGAYFAKSLLYFFKFQADKSTEAVLAAKKEKDTASVIALSQGIAALDEGNNVKAKQKLTEAAKIDPANAVASAFLSQLASASAKFKVAPERYVSYYNPAYLGVMDGDRLFLSVSLGRPLYGRYDANKPDFLKVVNPAENAGTFEDQKVSSLGYAVSVANGVGIGIEASFTGTIDEIHDIVGSNFAKTVCNYIDNFGGIVSAGFSLSPNVSVGVGVNAAYSRRRYEELGEGSGFLSVNYFLASGILAFLVKDDSGNIAWDAEASYGHDSLFWYDLVSKDFVTYNAPLYIEQTLTFALNEKATFLALKQANDVYFDRRLYAGRIMPCFEQWFGGFLGLRIGAEGTLFVRDGTLDLGWGGTAGFTLRFFGWNVDGNFTFRMRPSRNLVDTIIPEAVYFFTVSRNGIFVK